MFEISALIYSLFGCLLIGMVRANIAAFDLQLKDLLKMQQGYGWPHQLTVVVGHEALMKLTIIVENQKDCTVTTPTGQTFSMSSPPSQRYQHWESGCGVRIRDVQPSDYGRWRLTSFSDIKSVTGWIELYVEEDTVSYSAPPLSLQDGQTDAALDLTSLDNAYCLVSQPFSQSSLLPGHCKVTLDKATRAVQGNWNIVVGLPGRVTELHVDRQVVVQAERLDVGYIHDSIANKIHLYCNIIHTMKNVTFCRFQRTSDTVGYNVMEGLSDGEHSYYGEGFVAKHCGMTIEHPAHRDYGTWRCSVGSQLKHNNVPIVQTPMQALINVPSLADSGRIIRQELPAEEGEVRETFVQLDLEFTISCSADVSLTYCWFQHPDGSQYTPVAHTSEDQEFWYSGESLQTGDCGITFSHAKDTDAGDWICHMGPKAQVGVELTDIVNLRVTGPLAANRKEIKADVGGITNLRCHTSNGNRPLDYCRFLSPRFVGISLDETVTKEKAILDRFYFTPDQFLDHGDCSLTIEDVHAEDIGTWTCAALINNEFAEASDTITLVSATPLGTLRPLSQAAVIGMASGISILVVVLGGAVGYKYGMPISRIMRRRVTDQNTDLPLSNMRNSLGTDTTSVRSDDSGSSVEDYLGNVNTLTLRQEPQSSISSRLEQS